MAGETKVIQNLDDWVERYEAALWAVCEMFAAKLEAYAQQHAPWTDRTSNARQGLFGTPVRKEDVMLIVISHSVEYGVYLELAHSGKWSILEKTIDANIDEIYNTWKRVTTS